MAHGEEHAKQTVMIQATRIKAKLSNGEGADPSAHGEALLLLLEIVEPIFAAQLVTETSCTEKMKTCKKQFIGWPSAAAILGSAGMLCGLALKLFG